MFQILATNLFLKINICFFLQGIHFDEIEEPKEKFFRTGKHYLVPEDYAGVENLMTYMSHKPKFVPGFVLKGMFEIRKERNNFYKKCKSNIKGWLIP